jgi:Predicted lactoylglutathione lyase
MASKVFINLPVKNIEASRKFFGALGFGFNEQFSDDKAVCVVVSDSIFVMLLQESYFQTFTKKPISDAKKSTEVLIALDAASREEVESLVQKAVAAGGRIYAEPADHGWMYQHSFEDLDGHQWELAYLDVTKMPG